VPLGDPGANAVINSISSEERLTPELSLANFLLRSNVALLLPAVYQPHSNPPEMWVRKNAAFDPIVTPELFSKAQGLIQERSRKLSDEELLRSGAQECKPGWPRHVGLDCVTNRAGESGWVSRKHSICLTHATSDGYSLDRGRP
jgi:hypothetical protein